MYINIQIIIDVNFQGYKYVHIILLMDVHIYMLFRIFLFYQ
jgi:hypothetical protein